MKVSELIEYLQAEQARHGDVEVQVVTAKTELLPITLVTYDIYDEGEPPIVEIETGEYADPALR